jgi:hypothetical protein
VETRGTEPVLYLQAGQTGRWPSDTQFADGDEA